MKVKIIANTAIFTSAINYEELKKISKYEPAFMVRKDADQNEIFRLMIGDREDISDIGVKLIKNGENASATVQIPHEIENKKQYIMDTYGKIIMNCNFIEWQIECNIASIQEKITELSSSIEELSVE